MKALREYINESLSDLKLKYQYTIILDKQYELNRNQDKIIKYIQKYEKDFLNIGKDVKEVDKYILSKWDWGSSSTLCTVDETNVPIIKSEFIEKKWKGSYNNFVDYGFSILGPSLSREPHDAATLYSFDFQNITNVLTKLLKGYNLKYENLDLVFDINEFDVPDDDDSFEELYKDLTGSSRFPTAFDPDYTYKRITFKNPAKTILNKFIIPFIEKYTINFIFLRIILNDIAIYIMYDKSNENAYYIYCPI
jgi:hypothetical protein